MRSLASGHFSANPRESLGSSSVRASCGRAELLGEVFGTAFCEKREARTTDGRNCEQTVAKAHFMTWERTLRRDVFRPRDILVSAHVKRRVAEFSPMS